MMTLRSQLIGQYIKAQRISINKELCVDKATSV